MRSFEFARMIVEEGVVVPAKAYEGAKLPEYATLQSAGADFFCAEAVTINPGELGLVHTGIKASMEEDEMLNLYSRSSGPKKLGLMLANSVGVIDADYYNNPVNDGEIMFNFYNFTDKPVTIKVGDKIGQGVFNKFYRPEKGLIVLDKKRTGGLGSTDNNR